MKNWLFLFYIILCASSCSKEEDYNYSYGAEETLHVLIFGNSLSRDAFSYVPSVMEEVCPGLTIDMEILCLNGKSLSYHWDYLSNNKSEFVLDSYTSHTGRWSTTSGISGERVISSKVWDLIVMQEGSVSIRDYDTVKSHIGNISNYIKKRQADVKTAFMLSPASPDGSSALGNYTSDEVWHIIAATSYQLLEQNIVNYVIPCGTGIQNARYTSLDHIGDFGHLSYDGRHLQEGLPCLIEAYVGSQSLFDILCMDMSIQNSKLRITQQWVNDKRIPGQHGNVITGTENDYSLCVQCALQAVETPYGIDGQ